LQLPRIRVVCPSQAPAEHAAIAREIECRINRQSDEAGAAAYRRFLATLKLRIGLTP
jgi:hypothetical protein